MKGISILDVCENSTTTGLILFGYEKFDAVVLKKMRRDTDELGRLQHLCTLSISHPSIISFEEFNN
jgi:hypothetical protein